MRPEFWNDRRVLVTGHTGFKGAWLCLLLKSFGARVTGYALEPPTNPSLFGLARVAELVDSVTGDVRDLATTASVVRSAEADIVIHMAAQSVVLDSYRDPVDTYATNVIGTVNVLEAIRRAARPCTVVNVTTDKCYQNNGWIWGYRENDALGGHDPYSNSKACAELVGQSYRDSFFPTARFREHGVALASARAGNVIGGGDWTPHQLVPSAIDAFSRGSPVVLRHPLAIRPWQHVLDCLAGYLSLAEALAGDAAGFSGGWNFGPTDAESRSVSYVVEALARRWDLGRPWIQDQAAHAPEAAQLRLDVTQAASRLGWRCKWTIDAAVEAVADWYLGYRAGQDPRTLCAGQIGRYVA